MGHVRIIGGEWRGRRLTFPEAPGLRPTPDRVRETLFNWLGQRLNGQTCLDLFAGSGALGFEAASRGAQRVFLVERNRRLAASLHRWAQTLAPERVAVVVRDALQCAAAWREPVDLLFLDPPYRAGWLEKLTPHLDRLVKATGTIYAEAEAPIDCLGAWQVVKRGTAGQVHYHLLERLPQTNSDEAQ
ncbi:16S rRNA (guanine(966)-N(2))-methyltransferase RsmD [Hydrogenophilus thermoluteolus]|uniref:Methyltransferase n=1 Tax=Hydrogenophilus thermoluteolus TaxID=297 RepID=A0A2Z6DZX6_HYDTE|nr:16S rRNA (guanine(966)-N(2))-methyltransferase RsmD [Hydrogenophilus thermoluteolus]BBD77889.1 methyltransferase [Hydrogenophilus thermoluteolus]